MKYVIYWILVWFTPEKCPDTIDNFGRVVQSNSPCQKINRKPMYKEFDNSKDAIEFYQEIFSEMKAQEIKLNSIQKIDTVWGLQIQPLMLPKK